MITHRHHESAAAHLVTRTLTATVVAGALALVATACSNTAFESQPVDQDSTTSSTEADPSTVADVDTEADDELALVAESPYEEPDLLAAEREAEFSESAAEVPEDEPVAADPEDTAEVTQASVGTGESAVCATVQIGRDALVDGADELVAAQQELLTDRRDLVTDDDLSALLGSIDEAPEADLVLFEAALDRCEGLGFQP